MASQKNSPSGINEVRFIDHGDGTITDCDTELMWMNPEKIEKSTISKALQMSVHFAGYDDWRLPSIFELESIMPTNEISPPRNYFSSTINTSISASGNYYDLMRSDGKKFLVWEKSAKEEHILFVRNIHFRQWDQPKLWIDDPTVQISKVFDDFGRFIINDDGTVLDQSTALMWTYKFYPKKISPAEAMAITKEFAGYADWRIPSIADLQSIMPSGKKFFHFNQECKSYWTNDPCHVVVDIRGHWAEVFNRFTSLLRLVRDVPRHPIKVKITGTGSGDVKNFIVIQKNDGTLGKIPRTNNQYPLGTKIEVVAEPYSNSRFLKWSGDASGTDLGYLLTVDGPKSVVAEFEFINYKLTLHTTGSGEGSITPSTTAAEYPHGSVVTLTATPAQGSKLGSSQKKEKIVR